jgi:hypothetical protein
MAVPPLFYELLIFFALNYFDIKNKFKKIKKYFLIYFLKLLLVTLSSLTSIYGAVGEPELPS